MSVTSRALPVLLALAALAASPVGLAAPAATNPPAAPPPAGALEPLMRRAEAYERAGRADLAAAAFEEVVRRDPAKARVLGPHLVVLYGRLKDPRRALEWARRVAERHPDPQAYLAGTYVMLGDLAKARELLEGEVARAAEPRRKVALLWQLALVLERQGERDQARKRLEDAVAVSAGGPDHAPAQQRLQRFLEAPPAATNRPAGGPPPGSPGGNPPEPGKKE